LLSILLISSCGSFKNIGIEKRLYRPGYSVSTNSLKTVPAKNITACKNNKNAFDYKAALTEVQKTEEPKTTKKSTSTLHDNHLKKVKTLVFTKGKNSIKTIGKAGQLTLHKAKTILKPEKIISGNVTEAPEEGKSYSLSTVLFVVGAVIIIWGTAVFFGSISIMSADIALTLTILVGLFLVLLWGLIVLMVKSWFNGSE
jgi:hypothetical protein